MTWWAWLLLGICVGATVVNLAWYILIVVGHESNERRHGGMIDLVGATPHDPDDWFRDVPASEMERAGVVVKPTLHLRPEDAPPSPAVPPKL